MYPASRLAIVLLCFIAILPLGCGGVVYCVVFVGNSSLANLNWFQFR
jgi:hypothetical protein